MSTSHTTRRRAAAVLAFGFVFSLTVLAAVDAHAVARYGNVGAWEVGGSWTGGVAPAANDQVLINTAGNITYSAASGTQTHDYLTLGSNAGGAPGGAGTNTFNMTGGTLNLVGPGLGSSGFFIAGFANGANKTGVFNHSGGTLNVNSTFASISPDSTTTGTSTSTWNMSGTAVFNMTTADSELRMGHNAADAIHSGGHVTFTISGSSQLNMGATTRGITVGKSGNLSNAGTGANTAATVTMNLDGGTLTTPLLRSMQAGPSTTNIVFNGGVLKANASATEYMNNFNTAQIKNAGAIINTDGNNIGISQVLTDFAGNNGSLTKQGAGTLTLRGNNTYTGNTTISAGTLKLSTYSPGSVEGIVGWFDASDSATITHSGGAVSEWRSKASNWAVTQGTAGNRPTTGSLTQNGLNVIDFDGGDRLTTIGSGRYQAPLGYDDDTYSYIAVWESDVLNSGFRSVFEQNTGGGAVNSRRSGLLLSNANSRYGFVGQNNDTHSTAGTATYAANVPRISTLHLTGAATNNVIIEDYPNGTFGFSNSLTSSGGGAALNVSEVAFSVGANAFGTAGEFWDGPIMEVLVFDRTLPGADNNAIAAYLAKKWFNVGTGGTVGNLISTSPVIDVKAGATFDVQDVTTAFTLASGQKLTGSGTVLGSIVIANNTTIAPGASPGTMFTGNETWNPGGDYEFEINDVNAGFGTDPGWDLLSITGTLTLNGLGPGNEFDIELISLTLGNIGGNVHDFNNFTNYAWKIADATSIISTYTGTNQFDIDTSAFTNSFTGTFSVLRGDSVAGGDNTQLYLVYEAVEVVPEPCTLALAALGLMGMVGMVGWRRRRS